MVPVLKGLTLNDQEMTYFFHSLLQFPRHSECELPNFISNPKLQTLCLTQSALNTAVVVK